MLGRGQTVVRTAFGLMKSRDITMQGLRAGFVVARATGKPLLEVLVKLGLASAEAIARAGR